MQRTKDAELADLKKKIVRGLDIRSLLSPTYAGWRFRQGATRDLTKMLQDVATYGMQQVADELKRQ